MLSNQHGLSFTTRSRAALDLFDRAVDHYLEYRSDTGALLKQSIAADPDFVMPRVLLTSLLRLMGSQSVIGAIDEQLSQLHAIARPVSPREALHVEALDLWVDGYSEAASARWEEIVVRWPHDLVALRHLHYQNFWLGEQQAMRNAVAGALPAWKPDMPGYGFLLGMLAFGMEETGDYARAEDFGREAVERNADDMWAIHAVAHVMEMQGRFREGRAWLGYAPDHWHDRGPLKNHVWWHAALFAHEAGDFDAVLDLYDRHVKPDPQRRIATDMTNAPSLLARLEIAGCDVGTRWRELADYAEAWIDDHVIAYTTSHIMMPLARDARGDACERFLQALERTARDQQGDVGSRVDTHLLPIAKATRAYYRGDYRQVLTLLRPLRHRLVRIGGSHAQRDVFQQMLLEAAIRAGDFPLARCLAQERTTMRPHNHLNWVKLSQVPDVPAQDDAPAEAVRRKPILAFA